MRSFYFDSIILIERMHRLFLDVLKYEVEKMRVKDVTAVQALLLYNIGDDELTAGDLTQRGYYLGSNVSYNLRKMVDNGYVEQKESEKDRRAVNISLSKKGKMLFSKLKKVFSEHDKHLRNGENLSAETLQEELLKLEIFLKKLIGSF